jgi:hypothetical protein
MVWILVSLRVLWADWTFGRKSLPRTLVQSENVSLCCGQQCRCFLLAEACLRWWVHILSCNLRDRQRRWTLKAPAQRHRLPSASRKLVLKTLCIFHIYIYNYIYIHIIYTHTCKMRNFWRFLACNYFTLLHWKIVVSGKRLALPPTRMRTYRKTHQDLRVIPCMEGSSFDRRHFQEKPKCCTPSRIGLQSWRKLIDES